MRVRIFSTAIALTALATTSAFSQTDVFIRAVGFALTGSDNAAVETIDRAKCIFGITAMDGSATVRRVFHLNNVHVDRIAFQQGVRRFTQPPSETHYTTISLHGDETVTEMERTEPGLKETRFNNSELLNAIRESDPDAFKTRRWRTQSKEYLITLYNVDEYERLQRAWQYVYSNGCAGKKSPF